MPSGVGLLLISATGVLLFRPKDVPFLARNAGRIVGFSVKAIKRVRDAADDAVQRNAADSGMASNPTFKAVRSTVESSISEFSSISTSLRKEMSDIPLSPASFIRSRLRKVTSQTTSQQPSKNPSSNTINNNPYPSPQPQPSTYTQVSRHLSSSQHLQSNPPSFTNHSQNSGNGSHFIGVDFIARGIEEHALKLQKDKMFGGKQGQTSARSPSS